MAAQCECKMPSAPHSCRVHCRSRHLLVDSQQRCRQRRRAHMSHVQGECGSAPQAKQNLWPHLSLPQHQAWHGRLGFKLGASPSSTARAALREGAKLGVQAEQPSRVPWRPGLRTCTLAHSGTRPSHAQHGRSWAHWGTTAPLHCPQCSFPAGCADTSPALLDHAQSASSPATTEAMAERLAAVAGGIMCCLTA